VSLVIREITSSDFIDLLVIRNNPQVYKWFKNPHPIDEIKHQVWINERCGEYSQLTLVATLGTTVIGVAYLSKVQGKEAFVSISILPSMQSIKVGTKLFQKLKDNAVSSGIDKLNAEISIDNTKSINFFEFHGFNKVPTELEITEKPFFRYELRC